MIQRLGSAFIWYGSGSGASLFYWIPIRIWGFDDQKLKKIYSWKKITNFLNQKLQFTYPQAFIKDVQATEEAFSPQKWTSSTSKHEIFKFFLLFGVIFAILDPDTDPLTWLNPNADAIHCIHPSEWIRRPAVLICISHKGLEKGECNLSAGDAIGTIPVVYFCVYMMCWLCDGK